MYIYNKDSGYREKASDVYESTWVKGQDIVSFESFATDVDRFSLSGSNFKNEWEKYWNTFEARFLSAYIKVNNHIRKNGRSSEGNRR